MPPKYTAEQSVPSDPRGSLPTWDILQLYVIKAKDTEFRHRKKVYLFKASIL